MAGYGSDGAFATWLTDNGLTLPVSAPSPAILRQRGADYIDGLYSGVDGAETGYRWKGDATGGYEQERSWPRTGVLVGQQAVPDSAIPVAVERASYMAAFQEASSPGSLTAMISAAKLVKRQKVDSIEREFFGPSDGIDLATAITPVMSGVFGTLKPFLIELTDAPCIGIWSVGC